ncbi:MAG: DUF1800 domain-containing protein [Saprospiraceae bacterium]|nr:DUF1800 domain-containing protein [Saprospiraceae bacterium]MBK9630879.1 DUF1800 domain-containing protein [Saprospiraceae bacterium]
MKRAEFLKSLKIQRNPDSPGPLGSLDPYTGPWTRKEAIHLLRRATFGVKPSDVNAIVALGMNQAVNSILDTSNDPLPSPPLNVYSTAQEPDPTTAFGQTWVNAPVTTPIPPQYYIARTNTFKAWWTGNIIHQKRNILEKISLFWFNHFPIESDAVTVAQVTYDYYKLIRANAMGNFVNMVKLVSVHPAMLFYLNGQYNSKNAPDENYARELQELFTIGKGPDAAWTEDDVKAAAKILTGFRINPLTNPVSYYFDFNQHDLSVKRFSAFYGNKSITGKFGPAGEQELAELITMQTDHIETARHLVRKLYQFFVYYEITPEIESNVIRPLADFFKNSGYDIKRTLEVLFKSEHFYDTLSIGCVIKSPLDFNVGLCKEFNVVFPPTSQPLNLYYGWGAITTAAAYQGLNLADPPLVSGWQAWYQVPQYHEIWINADTLASRNNISESATSSKGIEYLGVSLKLDTIGFASALPTPEDASQLVKDSVEILYNYPISDTSIQFLKSNLVSGLPSDSYWTDIWLEYKANPNDPALKNTVTIRLNALYKEILSQAEYHLS